VCRAYRLLSQLSTASVIGEELAGSTGDRSAGEGKGHRNPSSRQRIIRELAIHRRDGIFGTDRYQPETFKLRKGIPARVAFLRKVEATCGTEIVLAEYNTKRELPLNQPVVVEFTPAKTGEFKFACGMAMLRGKIIVQ
jgi:hypothetical protein